MSKETSQKGSCRNLSGEGSESQVCLGPDAVLIIRETLHYTPRVSPKIRAEFTGIWPNSCIYIIATPIN